MQAWEQNKGSSLELKPNLIRGHLWTHEQREAKNKLSKEELLWGEESARREAGKQAITSNWELLQSTLESLKVCTTATVTRLQNEAISAMTSRTHQAEVHRAHLMRCSIFLQLEQCSRARSRCIQRRCIRHRHIGEVCRVLLHVVNLWHSEERLYHQKTCGLANQSGL